MADALWPMPYALWLSEGLMQVTEQQLDVRNKLVHPTSALAAGAVHGAEQVGALSP